MFKPKSIHLVKGDSVYIRNLPKYFDITGGSDDTWGDIVNGIYKVDRIAEERGHTIITIETDFDDGISYWDVVIELCKKVNV